MSHVSLPFFDDSLPSGSDGSQGRLAMGEWRSTPATFPAKAARTSASRGFLPGFLCVAVWVCVAAGREKGHAGPDQVVRAAQPLGVSRLFLEGRRGDEHVAPEPLHELRAFFAANGIQCARGRKVHGAWFDHIECGAQQFVDQAYGSVLAGARELTLFHLADVLAAHPNHRLLAERIPELCWLAEPVHEESRRGIAFHRPPEAVVLAIVRSLHCLGQAHVRAEQLVYDLGHVSPLLLRHPADEIPHFIIKVDWKRAGAILLHAPEFP